MEAEAARPLLIGCLRMRRHSPDRAHRQMVDPTHLVQGDQLAVVPGIGLQGLPVDPPGSLRVALDLHVLTQRLGAHRPASLQQRLNLAQHQTVALQRRGVVGLPVPDVCPDRLGLLRAGQSAQPGPQLLDGRIEAGIDRRPARPTSSHDPSSKLIHPRATQLNLSNSSGLAVQTCPRTARRRLIPEPTPDRRSPVGVAPTGRLPGGGDRRGRVMINRGRGRPREFSESSPHQLTPAHNDYPVPNRVEEPRKKTAEVASSQVSALRRERRTR